MHLLIGLLSLLMFSQFCFSRSIFRGTELGDKVKFSWTLKSKSLRLSVKLPETYRWIAFGLHDVPFGGNYWEDLAMITIDTEKGNEVSFLKTLHWDMQNMIYKSDAEIYEWAKRGLQKSKKNYYFTIKRDIDILPTSTSVTFMWAYGTDLSSDYPKVSEFKKVLLTLDDPLSLKEALEMMKSDVATTISSPLVSDGEKDEIKPSEEKNSSITTTANKITPPITEKSDTTISASLPNLPTKAPVDPVVITLHTATTTSTLPTTIPLAVVSEYFKSDSLPEVEKTSLPPVEPVVPKKPAIATDEQRTSASVDVSPSFPLNSVVDATEIPERSSIEINKKQEAFAEKTIVGKAKEKEVIDEYKSDEQHGRAKPKSSSVEKCGINLCLYSRCSEGKKCRVDLNSCTSSCVGKISMAVPGCNCTKSESWYSYFKNNENAVYFGVIGFSAFFTGLIVLCLACCCARRAKRIPRSRKNKVSFYKVDDFDSSADEEIEFLKSNEEDAEDEVYTKN